MRIIIIANAPKNVRKAQIMKSCPHCKHVFPDTLTYCTNDGTPLVSENLTLPSDFAANEPEEPTIIRRDPITIDFAAQNSANEAVNYQTSPANNAAPLVVVKQPNTGKYLLFLIVGLIFGGGLVLATLLLARNYYQGNTADKAANVIVKSNNSNANVVNREIKTPTATPTVEVVSNVIHQTPTDTDDSKFNGRVIVENAFVRASPSKTAAQTDVLPVNDRLHIEPRENENSPWFHITCEHGTSGWMHGNTIEFTE